MTKNILVNFNLKYNNKIDYFISKEISSTTLTEYILNFYGELKIGRSIPKELDILIITYSEEDKRQIELELLQL